MNLTQMELRRTEDLLRKVKEARHVAQAMRKPLAKYLALEAAIRRLVNGGIRRLNAVHETKFEGWDSTWQEKVEELKQGAVFLEGLQKEVEKRVKKLKGSPKLHAPSKPIEERIKGRRAKTKRHGEKQKRNWANALALFAKAQRELEREDARFAVSNIERYWREGNMQMVRNGARDFQRQQDPQLHALGEDIQKLREEREQLFLGIGR